MTLLDLIIGNYEEGTPERVFSEILSRDYEEKFNADDFDKKFDGVAGYKPIKTAAMKVAENYLDEIADLNGSDRDSAIKAFSTAYDDADKGTVNIHSIMDGIVEEIIDDNEFDEDDDAEDVTIEDDIEYDSDDD
jgi:hypothetical protein